MGRHSISLVVFCMVFGFLIGLAGFLGMAFLGGFVETPEAEAVSSESSYATGTERLEAYRCNLGATKQIVLGGIEDNFDPLGEENTTVNPVMNRYKNITQRKAWRKFDELGQDKMFVDHREVPERAYKGIMVFRIKDFSRNQNDNVTIGVSRIDHMEKGVFTYVHQAEIGSLLRNGWNFENGYYWADLDDLSVLTFVKDRYKNTFVSSLLKAFQAHEEGQLFLIHIADDTAVDFYGMAICQQPEPRKGIVYSDRHYMNNITSDRLPEGQMFLGYALSEDRVCDGTGCIPCEQKRPVACINDVGELPPDNLADYERRYWSGGTVKFSKPVAGDSFESEDDVDTYCTDQFGENWRHLNVKDGLWQGTLITYGSNPENYKEFWVGIKDQPHANCWDLRPDYENLEGLEATDD